MLGLMSAAKAPRSELAGAISACRGAFLGIAVMTGVMNVLYLTGSFFMLEVYDRVLPSRSIPTLVALSILALTLFTFQGILDVIRSRVMVRIAATLDERLSARVYDIIVQLPLKTRGQGDGLAAAARSRSDPRFLVSTGPSALFDLPWMPFYLGICFLFHPWIGVAALIGALDPDQPDAAVRILTRGPSAHGRPHVGARNSLAEASRRNAEVLAGHGHGAALGKLWGEANAKYLATQQRAADVAGGLGALSKVLRMQLQSGVLGLGAYLVIKQAGHGRHHHRELDPRRARAGAGGAGDRQLEGLCRGPPELAAAAGTAAHAAEPSSEPMALPAPKASLVGREASQRCRPARSKVVVQDVNFRLKAGRGSASSARAPPASPRWRA